MPLLEGLTFASIPHLAIPTSDVPSRCLVDSWFCLIEADIVEGNGAAWTQKLKVRCR